MQGITRDVEDLIELVGLGFDVFGVAVILAGILLASLRYLQHESGRVAPTAQIANAYRRYKIEIGLTLLLGLELLVAADIIKTVALEPDFKNLGVLGLLVLIRTFLSWTLVLEIEGRWPWQREKPIDLEPQFVSQGE